MAEKQDPAYPPGAWVFVSHSHKDLAKVRQIRDALERLGHKPLLFYLKCLEDDSAELPDILRREIEARKWFILCDSNYSRSSDWVQKEIEIIRSLEGKVYEVVDLEAGLDSYLDKVTRLSRRATIFISYARADADIAGMIANRLREEEYQVFDDRSIGVGQPWADQIASVIEVASSRGFVLILLSQKALESPWVAKEIQHAFEKAASSPRSAIVPVIVEDASFVFATLPANIRLMLGDLQFFDLTARPFEDAMADLVKVLNKRDIE